MRKGKFIHHTSDLCICHHFNTFFGWFLVPPVLCSARCGLAVPNMLLQEFAICAFDVLTVFWKIKSHCYYKQNKTESEYFYTSVNSSFVLTFSPSYKVNSPRKVKQNLSPHLSQRKKINNGFF